MKSLKILQILVFLILTPFLASAEMISYEGGKLIYDDSTFLMWIPHTFNPRNLSDANTYADAYYYDYIIPGWRLPTVAEFDAIVEDTLTPKISPLFDLGNGSRWVLWASDTTTNASYALSSRGYVFNFGDGEEQEVPVQSHNAFLLVRDNGFPLIFPIQLR